MTASVTSICNRALSEMGKSILITSLDDPGVAAAQCKLHYDSLRQQLLRMAPWGFARKTVTLTLLGQLTDTPPASPYPYLEKYLYPPDCLKFRYILAPPFPPADPSVAPDVSVQNVWYFPWCAPRRDWRFVVEMDDTTSPARRVLLSNVTQALGVYTADVTDPTLFDPLFQDALVGMLAAKLVIPLSGNVGMKQSFVALAKDSILQARVADGNEAVPSSDHTVDWMATRGLTIGEWNSGPGGSTWGSWYDGYDNASWGM